MRNFGLAVLAATLLTSSAFAAASNSAPLAAGKPAGVKQAQAEGVSTLMLLGGAAIIATSIILVSSNNDSKDSSNATSTSTTSP